ncbi:glycerate kinase [Glycomyces albus]
MRILIAPDKFAGTMTASEAAAAIAAGWKRARADDESVELPLADGGPGFVDVLGASLPNARRVTVDAVDPLGRPVRADYLRDGGTAYVESAATCGLHLLTPAERDPRRTTTYGLGQIMTHAVETGTRRIVVGLGGSATNDAGAGMLTALGLTCRDGSGNVLPHGGAALAACESVTGHPRTRGVELIAATDVDSPLLGPVGATRMFGPQKGARGADLPLLESALARFAQVAERDLEAPGAASLPGAGAAGGLGLAFFLLGGRRESGAQLTCRAVGLDAAIAASDLVVTGEGSFDAQSLRGKLAAEVAAGARAHGRPCLVMAGKADIDSHPELAGVYSVTDLLGGVEAAMKAPVEGLEALAESVAKSWH